MLETRRRALVHAVRSSLRGQTRRQSSEVVALRRRAAVATVRTVAVVVSVVATAILGRAIIAGCVVDALSIRAAAVLRESNATVGPASLIGAVAGGLHVVVVEGAGVEDDAWEEHALVHTADFGHVVVDSHTLILLEAGELVLGGGERELQAAVRVVGLCFGGLAGKTFGDLAVDLELG